MGAGSEQYKRMAFYTTS